MRVPSVYIFCCNNKFAMSNSKWSGIQTLYHIDSNGKFVNGIGVNFIEINRK